MIHNPRHGRAAVVIALLAALALLTGCGSSSGGGRSDAPSKAVHYVALGDSYSSGVGAPPYLSDSASCDRSDKAYSALWNAAHHPDSYRSVACSGAVTSDVSARQLSAVTSTTTLISITIGGNDAGFTDVLTACLLQGEAGCRTAVAQAESFVRGTLPGSLRSLFAAIHQRAPHARVVVLGYPRLYDAAATGCPGIPTASRTIVNAGADLLDTTIASATRTAGFTFVDVRGRFAGHAVCDATPWINALDPSDVGSSYHPNALGYRNGYLPAFTAAAG